MRHTSRWVFAATLLFSMALVKPAEAGKYTFTVKGDQVQLNGTAFKVIGLRTSNALISDESTDQLIKNLDTFKDFGVNTVSVYVMGSHFGDIKGYRPDASLDPVYSARLAKIIEAADQRGMIVLVGCLYWGASAAAHELKDWKQEDANKAIANTVRWLSNNNYRNVFVDPDNEGMAHAAKQFDISKMIDAGHAVDPAIMLANNCGGIPPANADLLIHYSQKDKDNHRPYIQTEGAPPTKDFRAGYWGAFSLNSGGGRFYNYVRIGRYTPEMKAGQIADTHKAIDKQAGYLIASTWLQCGNHENIPGPFITPGGLAESDINQDPTTLAKDAGILWWLQDIKTKYGPWKPPSETPATAPTSRP